MNRTKLRLTYRTKKGANGTEFARDDVDARAKIDRLKAQGCTDFRVFADASALVHTVEGTIGEEPKATFTEPGETYDVSPVSDTLPFTSEIFESTTPDTSSPDTGSDWSGGGGDFGGSGSNGDY